MLHFVPSVGEATVAFMTTDEEQLARLRRQLEAGSTLCGLPESAWPAVLLEAEGLPEPARTGIRLQRPQGPMQPFVGSRHSVVELFNSDIHDDDAADLLERVAAWPVLPLVGAEFEVHATAGIARAIGAVLGERLPGLDWWVPEHWAGPFDKYGFIHKSLPAPPNPATGEPMALELFGRAQCLPPFEPGGSPVKFPVRVVVEVATYSNVKHPGVGVPMYM